MIVDVFDEKSTSYKGYASWILMANSSDCYLIDSLTLREHMKVLEEVAFSLNIDHGEWENFQVDVQFVENYQQVQEGFWDIPDKHL